jgi:hypothetical protein
MKILYGGVDWRRINRLPQRIPDLAAIIIVTVTAILAGFALRVLARFAAHLLLWLTNQT